MNLPDSRSIYLKENTGFVYRNQSPTAEMASSDSSGTVSVADMSRLAQTTPNRTFVLSAANGKFERYSDQCCTKHILAVRAECRLSLQSILMAAMRDLAAVHFDHVNVSTESIATC